MTKSILFIALLLTSNYAMRLSYDLTGSTDVEGGAASLEDYKNYKAQWSNFDFDSEFKSSWPEESLGLCSQLYPNRAIREYIDFCTCLVETGETPHMLADGRKYQFVLHTNSKELYQTICSLVGKDTKSIWSTGFSHDGESGFFFIEDSQLETFFWDFTSFSKFKGRPACSDKIDDMGGKVNEKFVEIYNSKLRFSSVLVSDTMCKWSVKESETIAISGKFNRFDPNEEYEFESVDFDIIRGAPVAYMQGKSGSISGF